MEPKMELKAAVERYLEIVKEFDRPMTLSRFGLRNEDLEAMVSAWDEDYHLHRHFELIASSIAPPGIGEDATVYLINGLPYSAIVFKESIRHVFE